MQNVVDTTMTALMRVKMVSIAQAVRVHEDFSAKVLEPERTLFRTAENTLNLLSSRIRSRLEIINEEKLRVACLWKKSDE